MRTKILIALLAVACLAGVHQRYYEYSGDLPAQVVTQIKAGLDGLAYRAYQHANHPDRQGGALTPTECPIRHMRLRCRWDGTSEYWTWEYRTKPVPRTETWGE